MPIDLALNGIIDKTSILVHSCLSTVRKKGCFFGMVYFGQFFQGVPVGVEGCFLHPRVGKQVNFPIVGNFVK